MSDILKFQKKIKVFFKDKQLLQEALLHKSANQKNNNEKLEFLGDRVLGLVLSDSLQFILLTYSSKETETRTKSQVACVSTIENIYTLNSPPILEFLQSA